MVSGMERRVGFLEVMGLVKFPARWAPLVVTGLCLTALMPQPASAQSLNWFGGPRETYSASPPEAAPDAA